MKCKNILFTIMAGAVMSAAPFAANAVSFTFSNEFSGSGSVCANADCATLDVTQSGTGVAFVLTADLDTGEYIEGLYGNRAPYVLSSASDLVKPAEVTATFSSGADTYKADGDGFFDWMWAFSNSAGSRFDGTEVISWTFANTTLADIVGAVSVDGPDGKNGFNFALRVRGLGADNEGSGWFDSEEGGGGGGGGGGTVPEPGTLVLLGVGLAGLAARVRRSRGH